MLWKFLSSEKKVIRALAQSSKKSNDLSPANNDTPARPTAKSRLWLEDWSERDEARLRSDDLCWEGYVS